MYGIPGFKLEKEVVQRRVDRLAEGGVEFKLGFDIGRDASLEDLRARHDAIFIGTGVYKARELTAPGAGSQGVVKALDYLIASNRTGLGDSVPEFESGELNAEGKNVVVIGGGDTAMDCVRTAVRQGAKSVTCLYRRDRANMPGSQRGGGQCRGRRRALRMAGRAALDPGRGERRGGRARPAHAPGLARRLGPPRRRKRRRCPTSSCRPSW